MKKRIKALEQLILNARNNYYNGESTVSDKEFDSWIDELKSLDPTNKAVTSIGSPLLPSEWKKATHSIPMGSLDKVNLPSELASWATCCSGTLFVAEKLDGLSIELVYEQGSLTKAITRGDGTIGEDITSNVIKMKGVFRELYDYKSNSTSDFTGSLRGEIILTKSNHQKYFSDKANPRNAASGVSKRLDGIGSEHLSIILYQVLGDVDFDTEQEQFAWLKNHHCLVPHHWVFKNDKEVSTHWRSYQDTDRSKLDYDIDGLVIRINDLNKQSALGERDMRPKGAIAFKFDNEKAESTILKIEWQVGNSGRVTPVATIEPVLLVGAMVQRASIYNIAYINQLGISPGAKVLVSRANDVIPRIELVLSKAEPYSPPEKCPECNSDLVLIGENLNCPNTFTCPAQIAGRLKNWIAELNVLEWGDTLLERLAESKMVVTVADLYRLSIEDLMKIERMGEKSATKCYETLWASSEIGLDTFLGALSMTMIGSSTIKAIMNTGCDTIEQFFSMSAEDFSKVPGVGPIKAAHLYEGLKTYKSVIQGLLANGVTIKSKVKGALTGKFVCFTGASKMKRAVLEKMVVDAGGDVKSSVGKGLTYLVIADPSSTSAKAVSARKLGTKLISEEEFLEMVR